MENIISFLLICFGFYFVMTWLTLPWEIIKINKNLEKINQLLAIKLSEKENK